MISGKASSDATSKYAITHPNLTYHQLFPSAPLISQAGFGTYRVTAGVESHERALAQALKEGINLIDTSSNYGDGKAEMLIADVMSEAISRGDTSREAVVVVSKAGYIQGENLRLVAQRKEEARPYANVVHYAPGLDHCIHPDFLTDQLSLSLKRLQMDCIDVYLLHNPEYYLMWASKMHRPLAESREIYYQRIAAAFAHLEEEVAKGRIQWYGISSNTFPKPAEADDFTSLERVWELARSISESHHFRVIQLPVNLLETGAITEMNQSESRSALSFAREIELAVLVNRPLNAIVDDALIRLVDVPPPSFPKTPEEVSTAVDTLVEAELKFQQQLLPSLGLTKSEERPLLEQLAVGRILRGQWQVFKSYENWTEIRSRYLIPRAQAAVRFLSNQPNLTPEASEWLRTYVEAVDTATAAVSAFYEERAAVTLQSIRSIVADTEPEWSADSVSQTALRALRTTLGVSSVLVGMRRPAYVNDVLSELTTPISQKERKSAWQNMNRALT